MAARILAHFSVRCSMLDVRCFPSVQGFERANFHFAFRPAENKNGRPLLVARFVDWKSEM
ncbi:MAG: hypothetical protein DME21_17690 [Verrucomicrobia bacterium]|nr:MAG: hypothetical protein DME21_17690 [Verrucomicrobiota bacterium]